ncbi:MAG: cation diffusion facilitator family transporter [Desulfobacterota bacterium]|nr:cation diffusion facilitator family transporter [Thermodesulfobacteriota bacterium]
MDTGSRYRQIGRVLLFTLLLNLGVALVKLLYGWRIRSTSMTADGFHSLSDGSSNLVGLLGLWMASRPVDPTHPYGHKKYETLTAMAVAALLFLFCFNVIREGIGRLLRPMVPLVGPDSFLVMSLTITVNLWTVYFETKKGRELNSDLLLSDSLHTRADLLTSFSVLIALLAVKLGYPIIDPIVSLLVALFIGYAAVQILRETTRVLSDAIAIPVQEVERIVLGIRGVKECHKIRSRGRVDDIHMDLHVLVDRAMDVHKAHHLSNAIENKIKREFPGVTDVVVHIEPLEIKTRGNNG